MKKLFGIFAVILTFALAMTAFVACDDGNDPKGDDKIQDGADGHDYKVIVLGTDGLPMSGADVQLCLVENNIVILCLPDTVKTDSNGIAYIDIDQNVGSGGQTVGTVAVHVLNLPAYLSYEEKFIKRDQTLTIDIFEKTDSLVGGGTGTMTEGAIDSATFYPYKAQLPASGSSVYKVSFTDATKPIYFAFKGESDAAIYKISVIGDVNVKITLLEGNGTDGITKTEDSKSASGTSAALEFIHTKTVATGENTSYFEISLATASQVNKAFYVQFEYIDDYFEPTEG